MKILNGRMKVIHPSKIKSEMIDGRKSNAVYSDNYRYGIGTLSWIGKKYIGGFEILIMSPKTVKGEKFERKDIDSVIKRFKKLCRIR